MRPPRLIFLVFCFIFFPIFLTLFSVLTSSSRVTTPSSFAGRATGLHALFSFNIPASLFPPSAIISLTDDNSTFFLARPAAFGPPLPDKGLSGQLWIGSGFGDRTTAGAEGELGCSDIPGWGEGEGHRQDIPAASDAMLGKPVAVGGADPATSNLHRTDPKQDIDSQASTNDGAVTPSTNDGTDDHLHHPLPESKVAEPGISEQRGDPQNRQTEHADIQSLQESAEISGKVVLLSRGGCGFLEKVKWAQRRGGIALIVGDDTRGGSLITMYARGDTSNVTIPSLFTSYTTAHLLSSLVPPQAGGDSSVDDPSGPRHTKLSSQSTAGNQQIVPTMTSAAAVSPTSTRYATSSGGKPTTATRKAGFIQSLVSLLGIGRNSGRLPEDSQRPPSSGNIDWVLKDPWDDMEMSQDDTDRVNNRAKADSGAGDRKKPDVTSQEADGDGFMIGVQDWRDPDLLVPPSSSIPLPSSVPESDASKAQTTGKGSHPTASLKGGSITPGSGEYRTLDKSKTSKAELHSSNHQSLTSHTQGYPKQSKGWFARHFSWTKGGEKDSSRPDRRDYIEDRKLHGASAVQGLQNAGQLEHDGLWVTLTPTSMSTSPFFDTLLILVVSPLLTLTVVYALLLLRSRIRRRRWRAPKSLVDRLPVRTYHTISTSSSSTSCSSRSSSPGPVSPTSPLLGSKNRSGRRRSQETPEATVDFKSTKMKSSKKEKSGPSSALWRRKYTGRQVECVVCLEEYVDGQSRVMSLPCGHEFHAECITPWLTTRRRTCPICKGDVVRSMSQNKDAETRESAESVDHTYRDELDSHSNASSAPVPITNNGEDEGSDLERRGGSDVGLLERHSSSAPPPNWRNFAALSFSALSGDTIWHQGRTDRER
ncbi:PA and RING finger domain protein [Aspergillus bombycis]|uniref:RING-type E3 ubiquitin transferase n=1 Tax=Aspergillus bombycis TaxID=109264 RepID=A0A1F7ZVW2_9EURO|nr:PA and RING finger domain protein [Aspergillus bombycis]OGM43188.1 PA and RING finger domain protein [Aspergillus bombycis]